MPNFILNCQDLYGGGDYGDADLPDEIECQLIQKTLLINGAVRINFNLGGGAFDIILTFQRSDEN